MRPFNIFYTLGKDDKELIHSAFIKFLLRENDSLYLKMFGLSGLKFHEPKLENTYTIKDSAIVKGAQRRRIDIEILSKDENHIIFIENKFKSFPYEEQLLAYDEILRTNYKYQTPHKALLCFDKELIAFNTTWKIFDYKWLLAHIAANYLPNVDPEKTILITHYLSFLEEEYRLYDEYKTDLTPVFSDPASNRFWLKLFYSALRLRIEQHFERQNREVKFYINPGSSNLPLLNIMPGWKIQGKDLLIQLQGNEIKLYAHTDESISLARLVKRLKEMLADEGYKFKTETTRKSSTRFVLKTKLLNLSTSQQITLEDIHNEVMIFFEKMDAIISSHKE